MLYTSDAPPVRQLDVSGTPTANAGRYERPNCRLYLNGQGLPIAIRRVVSLGKPGSFAQHRYQAIAPNGIVALSPSSVSAWVEKRGRPVN
jgi:hypothetical protein